MFPLDHFHGIRLARLLMLCFVDDSECTAPKLANDTEKIDTGDRRQDAGCRMYSVSNQADSWSLGLKKALRVDNKMMKNVPPLPSRTILRTLP